MRIGIIQGRLTAPWNGQLQCFPRDHWQDEFRLAAACGLQTIELFVETRYNPDNPVWTPEGRRRLRELSAESGVAADTLTADCFMETTFAHEPEESLRLLDRLLGFGFRLIVLPFFERARIASREEGERIADLLSKVERRGVELALETTLEAEALLPLLDRSGLPACYDTGNTTALGHSIARDIRALGQRIRHVHVKDKRRSDGKNVLLGTGDTDFAGAFAALRESSYNGDMILETDRGSDPIATAKKHREFVKSRVSGRQRT